MSSHQRTVALTLAAAVVAVTAQAQTTVTRTDALSANVRVVIGTNVFGSTSPLQVVGLPAKTAGETSCLWLDASGNAFTGACLFASTAATISAAWTFSAGGTGLAVTNNATVGGTLGVTGASTLAALAATTGTFSGDVAVNGNDLTSTGVLTVRPTGNLTLDPTGDVVIAADGLDVLPATGYAYNLGALTNKYLTLHAAELWVETLVAQNTLATIGGRILVGPTTTLTADLGTGVFNLTTKHNNIACGDRVLMEANGQVEFFAIAAAACVSGSGPYVYNIDARDLDGSGQNAWAAGDAVFNTGTTDSGWIDLYSVRGVKAATEEGPTIVGNVRGSGTYNDWSPRWAVGNLNGLYGYSADTYGAAFGVPTGAHITIDPTSGLRFQNNTSTFGSFTGTSLTLGEATGARAFINTTGFAIYDDGNALKVLLDGSALYLGDSSAEHIRLTASILEFKNGSTVLGSLDGSTLTLGQPLTANNTGQIVIDTDSIDMQWRDNAGATSTVFRLSNSSGAGYVYIAADTQITTSLYVPRVNNPSGDLTLASTYAKIILQTYSAAVEPYADDAYGLGAPAKRWGEFYLAPTTTTTDYNPLVLGASGQLLEKTDGLSGTVTCTGGSSVVITVESGVVTAVTGTGCS